jgi:hypothetical protein
MTALDVGCACTPEDLVDIRRPGIHVALSIVREALSEAALQPGKVACVFAVGRQIVAKKEEAPLVVKWCQSGTRKRIILTL